MVSKKKQAKLARQAARENKNAQRELDIDKPSCSRFYHMPDLEDDSGSTCSSDSFFSDDDSDTWEELRLQGSSSFCSHPDPDGMPSFRDILNSFHLIELMPIECGFTEFLMSPESNSTEVLNKLLPGVIENMKFPNIGERLKQIRISAFEVFAGFFFRLMKFVTQKSVEEIKNKTVSSGKTVKQILSYDARERATAWYKRIKETDDVEKAEKALLNFKKRVATIYESLVAYREGKNVKIKKRIIITK